MSKKPTYISLFSGFGGMDLGLDRAGWECKYQVEIDPYCRKVLAKHWPHVPKHDDVRTFAKWDETNSLSGKEVTKEALMQVDLICGGFP